MEDGVFFANLNELTSIDRLSVVVVDVVVVVVVVVLLVFSNESRLGVDGGVDSVIGGIWIQGFESKGVFGVVVDGDVFIGKDVEHVGCCVQIEDDDGVALGVAVNDDFVKLFGIELLVGASLQ